MSDNNNGFVSANGNSGALPPLTSNSIDAVQRNGQGRGFEGCSDDFQKR